jgi:hypothetical protein
MSELTFKAGDLVKLKSSPPEPVYRWVICGFVPTKTQDEMEIQLTVISRDRGIDGFEEARINILALEHYPHLGIKLPLKEAGERAFPPEPTKP